MFKTHLSILLSSRHLPQIIMGKGETNVWRSDTNVRKMEDSIYLFSSYQCLAFRMKDFRLLHKLLLPWNLDRFSFLHYRNKNEWRFCERPFHWDAPFHQNFEGLHSFSADPSAHSWISNSIFIIIPIKTKHLSTLLALSSFYEYELTCNIKKKKLDT